MCETCTHVNVNTYIYIYIHIYRDIQKHTYTCIHMYYIYIYIIKIYTYTDVHMCRERCICMYIYTQIDNQLRFRRLPHRPWPKTRQASNRESQYQQKEGFGPKYYTRLRKVGMWMWDDIWWVSFFGGWRTVIFQLLGFFRISTQIFQKPLLKVGFG